MKTLLNPLTGHWAFGSGMVATATLLLLTALPGEARPIQHSTLRNL